MRPYALCSSDGLASLRQLNLKSNGLTEIPPNESHRSDLFHLTKLSLSDNGLRSWSDIDNLHSWCPNLEGLNVVNNPLFQDANARFFSRHFLIARLGSLKNLDSSSVTATERGDSEQFYINHIVKQVSLDTDEARRKEHPRWDELCKKHGRPSLRSHPPLPETMQSRLINVALVAVPNLPPESKNIISQDKRIRLLPSMTTVQLRMKIQKVLHMRRSVEVQTWLLLEGTEGAPSFAQIDMESERDLVSWGIDDGATIVVYTSGST